MMRPREGPRQALKTKTAASLARGSGDFDLTTRRRTPLRDLSKSEPMPAALPRQAQEIEHGRAPE